MKASSCAHTCSKSNAPYMTKKTRKRPAKERTRTKTKRLAFKQKRHVDEQSRRRRRRRKLLSFLPLFSYIPPGISAWSSWYCRRRWAVLQRLFLFRRSPLIKQNITRSQEKRSARLLTKQRCQHTQRQIKSGSANGMRYLLGRRREHKCSSPEQRS